MRSVEQMPDEGKLIGRIEFVEAKQVKCGMCGSPYVPLDAEGRVGFHEGRGSSRCPGVGGEPVWVIRIVTLVKS